MNNVEGSLIFSFLNTYFFLDECFVEKIGVPICGKVDENILKTRVIIETLYKLWKKCNKQQKTKLWNETLEKHWKKQKKPSKTKIC